MIEAVLLDQLLCFINHVYSDIYNIVKRTQKGYAMHGVLWRFLIITDTIGLLRLHRRNFGCDCGDWSPPLLKVVVTVTTTLSKWNLQFFMQFYV